MKRYRFVLPVLALILAIGVFAGGYAAWKEEECHSLYECAEKGAVRQLRERIRQGEDVNAQDETGFTALHAAALQGHRACVEALLEAGADPNLSLGGELAMTPLMYAAHSGDIGCFKALLRAGANPNAQLADGTTALYFTVGKGYDDCLIALLEAGADIEQRREKEGYGYTPLIWATQGGHPGCVDILLRAGADKEAQLTDGSDALMWAADLGHERIVKLLLQAGANPNATNIHQVTALMRAAVNGYEDCVKELLKGGADPKARDIAGDTARDYALHSNHRGPHLGCARLLEEAEAKE